MLMAVCFESIVEGTEQPSVLDRSFLECLAGSYQVQNHYTRSEIISPGKGKGKVAPVINHLNTTP
jgi:hypothetical protein